MLEDNTRQTIRTNVDRKFLLTNMCYNAETCDIVSQMVWNGQGAQLHAGLLFNSFTGLTCPLIKFLQQTRFQLRFSVADGECVASDANHIIHAITESIHEQLILLRKCRVDELRIIAVDSDQHARLIDPGQRMLVQMRVEIQAHVAGRVDFQRNLMLRQIIE